MARSSILTPVALSEPVKAGRRRFWKQVLPVTSINYDGQKIDFDEPFHMDLADAFQKQAYQQVPVVFADGKNAHNMDPRNFAGDVLKTEFRGAGKDGGTWALIETDKEGARAIQRNPKLGVSARIKQGIEKSDGRFFKRALNHVLLTMNPRVDTSPWQAVDLAEDADDEVVDLTAENYEEGSTMGKTVTKTKTRRRGRIDLSSLSDDEFNNLLDLAAQVVEDPADLDEEDLDEEEPDATVERKPRRRKSKVKVTKTTERDSEEDPGDEDDEEEDLEDEELDDEDEDTELSERVIRRSEVSQFGQMRIDLAARDWQTKRDGYLREGVPAFLLDLAEPVLSQPDTVTLDLSDSDRPLNVSSTITKMLDGVKRIVDLTGEIGNPFELDLSEEEQTEADALLKQWDEYSA